MIAVSFYLIQIQTNALILWLGGILCAVGLGTMQVMSQVSLVKNVEKDKKGLANSTYYMGMHLGHAIGGYLGGLWITGSGAQNFFYYFIPFALIPIAASLLFRKLYFLGKSVTE